MEKSLIDDLLVVLKNIEAELVNLELWSEIHPPTEAFGSTLPFCVDTLSLPQWIQFVLLAKLRYLVRHDKKLPSQSGVAPMLEEFFRGSTTDFSALKLQIEKLDTILTNA